jgi:hypothetical protein
MPRPGCRQALKGLAAGFAESLIGSSRAAASPSYELSSFQADITPPLGHALMGGGIAPAQRIDDRLSAHGFVIKGGELPVVLVSLDWCEVRNDAYDRWRAMLAKAARTSKERVLLVAFTSTTRRLRTHRPAFLTNQSRRQYLRSGISRNCGSTRSPGPATEPAGESTSPHLGLGQSRS